MYMLNFRTKEQQSLQWYTWSSWLVLVHLQKVNIAFYRDITGGTGRSVISFDVQRCVIWVWLKPKIVGLNPRFDLTMLLDVSLPCPRSTFCKHLQDFSFTKLYMKIILHWNEIILIRFYHNHLIVIWIKKRLACHRTSRGVGRGSNSVLNIF